MVTQNKTLEEQIDACREELAIYLGIFKEQENDIKQVRTDLAQDQQANATLLAWFKEFRSLVCKAAWALGLPDPGRPQLTSLGQPTNGVPISPSWHVHRWAEDDAIESLRAVAALDDSGYAPCQGTAPDGGSNAAHPLYQEGFAAGLASRQAPKIRSLRGSVPS